MQLSVYNEKGTKKAAFTLPEDIFGLGWNADLLHQVVVAYAANARTTVAAAKDRSEVRGGGIKPWRQKGTGRARHGSIRSPIWIGGGVTHGPLTVRDFSKKVNKKMKRKALGIALSSKLRDEELLLIDTISMKEPKTKDAREVMKKLSSIKGFENLITSKKNTLLIVVPERNEAVEKSFRNFGNVAVMDVSSITAKDVLTYKFLALVEPQMCIEVLKERLS